jgi:chromate reductase
MQQPEAYISRVDKLFDADGRIAGDGTRKFLQDFMQAFANWVETIRSDGNNVSDRARPARASADVS